jgi:hypothetical protein
VYNGFRKFGDGTIDQPDPESEAKLNAARKTVAKKKALAVKTRSAGQEDVDLGATIVAI